MAARPKVVPRVVIVGGGAAGIFAALRAAELGAEVILLEKTSRLGTKILISGGGKCNIAHDGPLEDVIRAFRPNEARFLRPACYRMPNDRIIERFTERGLKVYTRPDGRVFPIDQTAKDVVAILTDALTESGVDVRLNSPVCDVITREGAIAGVRVGPGSAISASSRPKPARSPQERPRPAGFGAKALLDEVVHANTSVPDVRAAYELPCTRLVLATGGCSYPASGTTGDGWPWTRAMGHSTSKLHAALAPITLAAPMVSRSGVALRDCILKARQAGKEVGRWRGDLLFTHQGVSGPSALGLSRIVAESLAAGAVQLEVDLCPALTADALTESVLHWQTNFPKRLVSRFVEEIVPQSLAGDLLAASGIDPTMVPEIVGARLDKKSRNRLVHTIKAWNLGDVRHVPVERGEVVAGGVSLDEVDPHTMRSRLVPGLFLCGEILDIAGPVGGYNLQAAFATGYVAGESAALS